MQKRFQMVRLFGPLLADGQKGNAFRMSTIEPALFIHETIVFDFSGVENMTDSFANGCFANLIRNHRSLIRRRVRFENCSILVRDFVASALSRGEREANALDCSDRREVGN